MRKKRNKEKLNEITKEIVEQQTINEIIIKQKDSVMEQQNIDNEKPVIGDVVEEQNIDNEKPVIEDVIKEKPKKKTKSISELSTAEARIYYRTGILPKKN